MNAFTPDPTDSLALSARFPVAPPEAPSEPHDAIHDDPDSPRLDPYACDASIKLEYRGLTPQTPADPDAPKNHSGAARRSVRLKELQQELILGRLALKETIVCKLGDAGFVAEATKLDACHTKQSFAVCADCSRTTAFFNRCEQRHCPMCAHRLARERRDSIEFWTHEISQPKHVVLTVRNSDAIDKARVRWFKACFAKLRRTAGAANWRGGMWSLEVTNEGRGWHLHLHALVDADWIGVEWLKEAWSRLVGQDIVIVKVKDCRGEQYLKEVAKYVVKGSQLAGWDSRQIGQFIRAFDGERTFGVFGTLFKRRAEWSAFKAASQGEKPACECGCSRFRILSPNELEWDRTTRAGLRHPVIADHCTRLPLQPLLL